MCVEFIFDMFLLARAWWKQTWLDSGLLGGLRLLLSGFNLEGFDWIASKYAPARCIGLFNSLSCWIFKSSQVKWVSHVYVGAFFFVSINREKAVFVDDVFRNHLGCFPFSEEVHCREVHVIYCPGDEKIIVSSFSSIDEVRCMVGVLRCLVI